MTTALLVDADILAYQFAAAAQRTYEFGVAVDPLEEVVQSVTEWVASLEDELDGKAIICLSCPSAEGWRVKVLPSYKANRADVVRPVLLAPIKDWLEANYPSYRRPTLEADDIMGILSTMKGLPRGLLDQHPQFAGVTKKVIVSEDKDMKTIPGWLFNPAKDSKPRRISEEEAARWHLYQTLVGDTTDGYKGCPGCGPVKANKLLDAADWENGPWPDVVAAFVARGLTEEDALVQARVARICHASDYDFKAKEVRLWTPQPLTSKPAPARSTS